ncbi:ATP-binding protein [Micromonospora sp. IBSANI012]|uniref:ATP-binding protein n=1 Tax=Micromonospora sp. IBSANI012 TaxID=3457761 RepID=UPI0040583CDF
MQATDEKPGLDSDPQEDRSVAYKMGLLVGALVVWAGETAQELIAEHREASRRDRDERREKLIKEAVDGILARPEFSHSVTVHGSRQHVVEHIQKNEKEIFNELWDHYNQMVRDLIKGASIAGLFLLLILIGIKGLISKWEDNNAAGKRGFPSTLWLEEAHRSLGDAGFWALGIVAGFLVSIVVADLLLDLRSYLRETFEAREDTKESLTPHVRVAVNEWSDEKSPTELRFEEAPGLSSTGDGKYLVERDEHRRIRSLVRELGASAVAISGPRGAGKSTLLRGLAEHYDSPQDLFIALEAPSSYQPKEFVITLYQQLCTCIQRKASGLADSTTRRFANNAITTLRFVAILLSLVILVSQWTPIETWLNSQLPAHLLPRNGWQAAAYLALVLVVRTLLETLRPRRGMRGAAELVQRAAAESSKLRFLQNVAIESSGVFKASFGFDLGRKHTKQLLEQATSMPDLVQSYRSLATDAVSWWRHNEGRGEGNLVVVIDELDRVTDVEAAERFINDVKGIFGIIHCTYLVTVSEDALAQFERRMVGIRPVLDSTFDEVVRLPILTFAQSREILARRLVGFPQAFIALCHALSGGIPRDLIRTARGLIDARRTTGQDHLVPLAQEVVRKEIATLKSGLIGRINSDATEPNSLDLLRLLADSEWPDSDPGGLLRAAAEVLPSARNPESRTRISMQLGVALYYYATILEIFEEFAYQMPWEARQIAERLAVARSVMPTSVDLAYVHIQRLRSEVGFEGLAYGGAERNSAE